MTNQFKAGDKVKVVCKVEKEDGWNNIWVSYMDEYVGQVYTVNEVSNSGIYLKNPPEYYGFPLSSLELVEELSIEPKTTPRKHADLIKQWADDASLEVEIYDGYSDRWSVVSHPVMWNEDEQYRIKPKAKVKRWKWVMENKNGDYYISTSHYTETEALAEDLLPVVKIEQSEIEEYE